MKTYHGFNPGFAYDFTAYWNDDIASIYIDRPHTRAATIPAVGWYLDQELGIIELHCTRLLMLPAAV